MKNNLKRTLILFTSVISLISYSQPGVDWQLAGNVGVIGNFLGTTNNIPLDFRTANLQRAQITSIPAGSPLFPGSGVNNALPGNRLTRMSISYDANFPITNPYSLLHIGDQTGQGVRFWMGCGLFIGQGSDQGFFVS